MSFTHQNKAEKSNNLSKSTSANKFKIVNGWLNEAEQKISPHFSNREITDNISVLVIHNISLPAGNFGGNYITQLFLGTLDCSAHHSFADLSELKVSAHCLIRRDGSIIQYVSFDDKAWHAGVSIFNKQSQCNDFSIGIELEGTDDIAYEKVQYEQLALITAKIQQCYPLIENDNIVGHCDIAPGRKTDPGDAFNWQYFYQCLKTVK